MADWRGALRSGAIFTGKALAEGSRAVARQVGTRTKNVARKRVLLNRMSDRQVRALARSLGVQPTTWEGERPTSDDYRTSLVLSAPLDQVVAFARKHGVVVADVEAGQREDQDREARRALVERLGTDDVAATVAAAILEFAPSKRYHKEFPYQIELAGYLRRSFPGARIEESRGSTRPDISIGGLAIEVKGPTRASDLRTIADKCMRYAEHFPDGLIVVLFAVEVGDEHFQDWERGLKRTFPAVVVVRK